MNKFGFRTAKIFIISPLVLALCFYAMISPLYFQGGDSAELVNASYHLFVPHPPGYPLYIWLNHFWLTSTTFSSVFFRASLLSAFFSLCTLTLLFLPLRKNFLLLLIPFVFLGMNPVFVESAVIPDVFSLHGFFVVIVFTLFFSDHRSKDFLIPFVFCLSLTNHHTTILLVPIMVYLLKGFKKITLLGFFCGTVICAIIYLSMLFFHHSHPYSWGNVKDIGSVINHFLRMDYGTFNLSPKGVNQGLKALIFLMKSIVPIGLLLGFIVMRGGRKLILDKKFLISLAVMCLCFIFTLMANVAPENIGEEILKRFHIMPMIILTSIIVYAVGKVEFKNNDKIFIGILIVCTGIFQGYYLKDFLNLRNDSIIQDYSQNIFNGALANRPIIITARGDTDLFGIRYISSFMGNIYEQKVAVITLDMLSYPWFFEKIKLVLPKFDIKNKEEVYIQKELNVDLDILRPNLKNYNFLMTTDYKEGTWFKLVFLPLGRLIKEGQGTFINPSNIENLKINYRPKGVPKGPQHYTKGFLFYQYSHIYMAEAYHHWENKNLIKSKLEWEKAIQIVPFALPAMINLCAYISNKYNFCQEEKFKELEKDTKGFY
jgi:hypothetical protein